MWAGSPSALDLRREMGPVAGLGGRRSRVLGTPGAHVLPPCQLASWPPGAGLSFARQKPLWPVAACSTPSAAEVVAMPLLLAAPSGWGRGGRVVAAPVEFHLSGGATFCRRSSSLEECHHRRRARGRRGSRPDERCAELRLLRRTWPLGGRGNSYFISPRSQGGCSGGGAPWLWVWWSRGGRFGASHLQRSVSSYGRRTSPGGEPPLATDA